MSGDKFQEHLNEKAKKLDKFTKDVENIEEKMRGNATPLIIVLFVLILLGFWIGVLPL